MKTCSNWPRLVQTWSNLLKLTHISWCFLWIAQTWSNTYRHAHWQGMIRLAQTRTDLFSLAQTCSDLLRLAQTCSNLLRLAQTCFQNRHNSTDFSVFETMSDTYKVTTLGLLYPRWFHKFFFYKFTRIWEDWVFGWNCSLHQPLALAQWFFTTPLHSLAEHKTKSSQLPKLYHDLGCWKLCAKVHEKLGVT